MKSGEVPSTGQEATSELARAYLDLKRQYDDLVSRSLAGIFRSTVDGRFLECNDAMAHILGYADRDALMRHQAVDLYYSEAERNRFLDTLFRERRLTNFEIVLKHRVVTRTADTRTIYELGSADAIAAARGLDLAGADCLLFTGTGMPTLAAIETLGPELGIPVLSTNLCLAAALCRALGVEPPAGPHPLLNGWQSHRALL